MIKDVTKTAYDDGADMIVKPCPVCQMNVEVCQDRINEKYGTKFNIPVTHCNTLMSLAYGKSGKEAGLDGQVIPTKQQQDIASKQKRKNEL